MRQLIPFIFLLILSNRSLGQQPTDTILNSDRNNNSDTTVYTEVDSIASFPGGRPAWIKYIQKTLNPSVGVDNGAKRGTYNVIIKFTVTKDGSLKDFEPITKYKHGFEEEVIRVLKVSPKWIPAKKNGVIVNSRTEQKQVFIIEGG
jgi:hypothetical protein